jgi:hypothetical protein
MLLILCSVDRASLYICVIEPNLMLHCLSSVYFINKRLHVSGIIINSKYALQPFKAYCAILVRLSNFRHQASSSVSPRESTQRRKVELWARNVR